MIENLEEIKMDPQAALYLENQLCFPLYVCAKEVIKAYTPYLEPLGLTYTQYIVMLCLWQYGPTTLKELGKKLYLEANTLSPLIRRLEDKGYLSRRRSQKDRRDLIVELTEKGLSLKEQALPVPGHLSSCISLDLEKAVQLQKLLYELLERLVKEEEMELVSKEKP